MKEIFINLNNYCRHRIEKYGAPYFLFAVFGIINYPVSCFVTFLYNGFSAIDLVIRGIATLLSCVLLFKHLWPETLRKYLPLYWYVSITFSVPFLSTCLLLENNEFLWWLMNYITAVIIFIMLVDSITFIVLFALGILSGILFYSVLHGGDISWDASYDHSLLALYMFVIVFILCVFFMRNKEILHASILDNKEELNKNLEDRVQARTVSLNNALRVKDDFLTNINHEIRTPVQVIKGVSSLLLNNQNSLSEIKKQKLLKQLLLSSDRLFKLVTNVLDLLKFKQQKMSLCIKSCNIISIVRDAIDEIQFLAQQKNIQIKFKGGISKDRKCFLDRDKTLQVINNLLSNSIKYSPENTTIRVLVTEVESYVKNAELSQCIKVSIIDEGVGIPESDLLSIFGAFSQGSRTNNKAGSSGLGLSIAAEIIYSHGGIIKAENNPDGIGSIFSFVIPYDRKESVGIKGKKSKNQVLFVDDEQGCCIVGSMLLENEGFKVHSVNSASEAFDYLEKHCNNIGIVFLDMMMPGMSGLECLKKIKSKKEFRDIPVVIQSGINNDKELNNAIAFGASACISKPYIKDKILSTVEMVMLR